MEPKPVVTTETRTYWWSSFVARLFCWLFCFGPFGIRIRGLENIPKEGRVILASNHLSYVDIMLVGGFVRKRHLCFAARESLGRYRIMAKVIEGCGCVPIDTESEDTVNAAAQAEMRAHLETEDALVIYAEGTRSPNGKPLPFEPGAAILAKKTKTNIVPVAIKGTFWVWPKGRPFPLPGFVSVEFGPPIRHDDPRATNIRELADLIEATVCEMLGETPAPRPERRRKKE